MAGLLNKQDLVIGEGRAALLGLGCHLPLSSRDHALSALGNLNPTRTPVTSSMTRPDESCPFSEIDIFDFGS